MPMNDDDNERDPDDLEDEDDKYDPYPEDEGWEKCPICEQMNFPGAGIVCEHYIAMLWDADLIGGDYANQFQNAWCELQDVLYALTELVTWPIRTCEAIAQEKGIPCTFLNEDLTDTPTCYALESLLDFSQGQDIVTGGMLSGLGYTLYLAEPGQLTQLTQDLINLTVAVRAEIAAGRVADEEDEDDDWYEDAAFDSPCIDEPYPHVVVHWAPAVYGYRKLRFGKQLAALAHEDSPVIDIPFDGKLLRKNGELCKRAVDAVITQLQKCSAAETRDMCLVLSPELAIYIDRSGKLTQNLPPRGGIRIDWMQQGA